MNPQNKTPLDEIYDAFKPLTNCFSELAEQLQLAAQCRMRRFVLVRNVDTTGISGTGIIAEGVVFEDKTVAMRWKTQHRSTCLYDSMEDLLKIHGHGGKTVVKYVDAEKING